MELSLLTWLGGWLEHWRVMLNSTETYVELELSLAIWVEEVEKQLGARLVLSVLHYSEI